MKRTEKPIIFSGPMVRAILAGNKTQTRRVIRFPKGLSPHWYHGPTDDGLHDFMFGAIDQANRMAIDWSEFVKAPYAPGDVLWVRETWQEVYETEYDIYNPNEPLRITDLIVGFDNLPKKCAGLSREWSCSSMPARNKYYVYEASKPEYTDENHELKWRPSIFMPREAAGMFLRVTDVRAERVRDITDEDGKREGACGLCYDAETGEEDYDITLFKVLWDGLNAKRGYGWATNPWVWVIAFERIENHQEKAFGNA